jgi:hypothetical protein
VNNNGAEWKQLVDRAEAERHILRKFLDGQALITGLFRLYAVIHKEMTGQVSTDQQGIGTAKCLPSRSKYTPKERQTLGWQGGHSLRNTQHPTDRSLLLSAAPNRSISSNHLSTNSNSLQGTMDSRSPVRPQVSQCRLKM